MQLHALRLEQGGGASRLIEPDFDRRQAAGRQQFPELRGEDAIGVQPFRPGEQGFMRLILGDAGPRLRIVRDIGRVAQDQVERRFDALGSIAQADRGTVGHAQARRIALRIVKRRLG